MKVTIIVDSFDELRFIDRIIAQGTCNSGFNSIDELKEAFPTIDNFKTEIKYIKNTPELEECINNYKNDKENTKPAEIWAESISGEVINEEDNKGDEE